MPEQLVPYDVEQYTKGRLSATDPETIRALDAALIKARRYCGWHVSPVITKTVTLDGHGSRYLFLPTLKIVTLTSVTVDGEALSLVDDVKQLAEAPGALARDGYGYWPRGYGNISVEMTHGYTAAEAADFREAVLRMVDQASQLAGQAGVGPLTSKRVDDVEYQWAGDIEYVTLDSTALAYFRLLSI